MENTTVYGTSLEIVYETTIPKILQLLEEQQDIAVHVKGLSATVIVMSYALVESKMWSAVKRLTNNIQPLSDDQKSFLADRYNWQFGNRKEFLSTNYGIDIESLDSFAAVKHLGNLRNVVAHGGDVNVERESVAGKFKFTRDSFRRALIYFNPQNDSYFHGKSITDDQTVQEIVTAFLTLDFVSFYYEKVKVFLADFEAKILEAITSAATSATSQSHDSAQ